MSMRDVQNALKERLDSVLGMEVADVVLFQTVTKEPETNCFVQLMEVASVVRCPSAVNLPLEAHNYVRSMAEDAVVQSKDAKNPPSLQQSFALNMAVERNVVILAARK